MPIDLSDAGIPIPQFDLDELSRRLGDHASEWIPEFYPRGVIDRRGDTLRLANIRGAPPRREGSCVINLKGDNAGNWFDHSTGKGGKPLSTLAEATGLHGTDLFERATEIVGDAKPKANGHSRPAHAIINDRTHEIAFIRQHCVPALGTLIETYLASRQLDLPDCPDLLFHPCLTDWNEKIGRPAMVAVIRDPVTGEPVGGVHRTYLADDGRGKADMPKPKMMLGPSAGVVMLMPMAPDGTLGVSEGIETGLAAAKIFDTPVWAALSAGNLRNMSLPPGLKKLAIFADRGADGETAAAELCRRATTAGVEATVILPRGDDDFAEDLALGLWTQPQPPTLLPEIMPPPTTEAELLTIAPSLTKDSPELQQVLKACVALNPLSRSRILEEVKKSTRYGLGKLEAMVKSYKKEVQIDQRHSLVDRPAWLAKMETYDWGEPKAIMMNVTTALREDIGWRGVIGFNEFAEQIACLRRPPFEDMAGGVFPRAWSDDDDLRLTEWLQRRGLHIGREIVVQGVPVIARENPFHPVRDWLDRLEWDGEARLDFWLQGYVGAADGEYARAVSARSLLSAVARIYHPGCKADCVLILEGGQGIGKSSALRILFAPWFTDEIADLGSKDSAMQLRGVWGVELAELDAMSRAEISKLKAFLGQTDDRYRPPYGRTLVDIARQCVFCGSVNDSDYLRDPTGGRRFWPVKCGEIDLSGLHQVREQLWAEAVTRYQAGERWHLHERGLIDIAIQEQAERYQGDEWGPLIDIWIERKFPPNAWRSERYDVVRIGEILEDVLNIERSKWTIADQKRVAKHLKSEGWHRHMQRKQGTATAREWVFRRERR